MTPRPTSKIPRIPEFSFTPNLALFVGAVTIAPGGIGFGGSRSTQALGVNLRRPGILFLRQQHGE